MAIGIEHNVGTEHNAEKVGSKDERESCGAIMGEVIGLWDKGNHNMDSKPYKALEKQWTKHGCDQLEGFPPFSKIPKS